MRNLMEEDGERSDGAHTLARQEGRTNGQPVGEVVGEVCRQVEVPSDLDCACVGMTGSG